MSRCSHNDHPGLEPCQREAVGPGCYCVDHGCCLCGGVMLADTEDWKVHLCVECYSDVTADDARESEIAPQATERLVSAAYEAGRFSVIGHCEPDDVVEGTR